MRVRSALRLAASDLGRGFGSLALSGVGIVVGIASFVFFVALGNGMRELVLRRIYVVDNLEIVPRSYDLGPFRVGGKGGPLGSRLDGDALRRLASLPGVTGVFPKMRFAFKAMGWAGKELLGRDVFFELFVDGIDPALVAGELGQGADFRRRPDGQPVPVLVSPHLLEFFNGSVARVLGLPRLTERSLVGIRGHFQLGKSFVGRETRGHVRTVEAEVVGLSDKAIPFGATIPIEYVREFNRFYRGEEAVADYDSALVRVASTADVAAVAALVREAGFDLGDRSRDALRAGMLLSVLTLVFGLVSLVIVGVAAVAIAHTFLTRVSERRRELGVMRAVGATRGDVATLILVEAGVAGLVFGTIGLLLGAASCVLADAVGTRYLPDFPFKPESFFVLSPGIVAGGLALSVLFSVVGAMLPALRAARMDPADALTPR